MDFQTTQRPQVGHYIIATKNRGEDRSYSDRPYKVIAVDFPHAIIEGLHREGMRSVVDLREWGWKHVSDEFLEEAKKAPKTGLVAILDDFFKKEDGPCPIHGDKCPEESDPIGQIRGEVPEELKNVGYGRSN